MTRFDNFLDTVLGVLVVALIVASIRVGYYVTQLQPLGVAGTVLLFFAGACIGAVFTYYLVKGREKP